MSGIFGRLSFKSLASEDMRESYGLPEAVNSPVHGVQLIVAFNPVDHAQEPTDQDNPVKCPQPQPCILHDGRILKERLLQANNGRITVLPVLKEDGVQMKGSHRRSYYLVSKDTILKLSE